MTGSPNIIVEDNAPPIVRIFASILRSSASRRPVANLISQMTGTFAISSIKDPQRVSITVHNNVISLKHGVSRDAKIILHVDLNKISDKEHPPRIENFWRHPLFTYQVGKLLSEPPPNWADCAKRFWSAASSLPDMPGQLLITCTDDDRSLSFGDGESKAEIIGHSTVLTALFLGQDVLVSAVISQKVRLRASMRHMAGLSNAGLDLMMGEIHG